MEEGSVTAQETGFNEDLVDEAKPLLIDQSKSDAPDREEKEIVECENDKQGIYHYTTAASIVSN